MENIILIIVPTLDGGLGTVNTNLAGGLLKKDKEVVVVSIKDEKNLKRKVGPKCICLGRDSVKYAISDIVKIINSYDVSHIISSVHNVNIISLLCKYISEGRCKNHLVEHISIREDLSSSMNFIVKSIYLLIMSLCYSLAETVSAVSKEAARELEETLYTKVNVKTLYNPVVNSNLVLKSVKNLSWGFDTKRKEYLLSIGRFTDQKNFSLLIESYCNIEDNIDEDLVILGEGPLFREMKQYARKKDIYSRVLMPGYISNPYPIIRNASLFVLSSRWEGLPTVLIEALYLSTPVVSTRCPTGPTEILSEGRYGRLVPSDNAQALSEAIYSYLRVDHAECIPDNPVERYRINEAVDAYINKLSLG